MKKKPPKIQTQTVPSSSLPNPQINPAQQQLAAQSSYQDIYPPLKINNTYYIKFLKGPNNMSTLIQYYIDEETNKIKNYVKSINNILKENSQLKGYCLDTMEEKIRKTQNGYTESMEKMYEGAIFAMFQEDNVAYNDYQELIYSLNNLKNLAGILTIIKGNLDMININYFLINENNKIFISLIDGFNIKSIANNNQPIFENALTLNQLPAINLGNLWIQIYSFFIGRKKLLVKITSELNSNFDDKLICNSIEEYFIQSLNSNTNFENILIFLITIRIILYRREKIEIILNLLLVASKLNELTIASSFESLKNLPIKYYDNSILIYKQIIDLFYPIIQQYQEVGILARSNQNEILLFSQLTVILQIQVKSFLEIKNLFSIDNNILDDENVASKVKEYLEGSQKHISYLENQKNEVQKELTNKLQDLENKENEIQKQLTNKILDLENKETEIRAIKENQLKLRKEKESLENLLKGSFEELEKRNKLISSICNSIEPEIKEENVLGKIQRNNEEITRLNGQINSKSMELGKLRKEKSESEDKLKKEKDISEANLNQQIKLLTDKNISSYKNLEDSQSQIKSKEKEKSDLLNLIFQKDANIKELENKNQDLTHKLQFTEDSLNELQKKDLDLIQKLQVTEASLNESEKKNNDYEKEIEHLSNKLKMKIFEIGLLEGRLKYEIVNLQGSSKIQIEEQIKSLKNELDASNQATIKLEIKMKEEGNKFSEYLEQVNQSRNKEIEKSAKLQQEILNLTQKLLEKETQSKTELENHQKQLLDAQNQLVNLQSHIKKLQDDGEKSKMNYEKDKNTWSSTNTELQSRLTSDEDTSKKNIEKLKSLCKAKTRYQAKLSNSKIVSLKNEIKVQQILLEIKDKSINTLRYSNKLKDLKNQDYENQMQMIEKNREEILMKNNSECNFKLSLKNNEIEQLKNEIRGKMEQLKNAFDNTQVAYSLLKKANENASNESKDKLKIYNSLKTKEYENNSLRKSIKDMMNINSILKESQQIMNREFINLQNSYSDLKTKLSQSKNQIEKIEKSIDDANKKGKEIEKLNEELKDYKSIKEKNHTLLNDIQVKNFQISLLKRYQENTKNYAQWFNDRSNYYESNLTKHNQKIVEYEEVFKTMQPHIRSLKNWKFDISNAISEAEQVLSPELVLKMDLDQEEIKLLNERIKNNDFDKIGNIKSAQNLTTKYGPLQKLNENILSLLKYVYLLSNDFKNAKKDLNIKDKTMKEEHKILEMKLEQCYGIIFELKTEVKKLTERLNYQKNCLHCAALMNPSQILPSTIVRKSQEKNIQTNEGQINLKNKLEKYIIKSEKDSTPTKEHQPPIICIQGYDEE